MTLLSSDELIWYSSSMSNLDLTGALNDIQSVSTIPVSGIVFSKGFSTGFGEGVKRDNSNSRLTCTGCFRGNKARRDSCSRRYGF